MDVIPLVFGASAIVVGLALMGRLVVLSRANAAAAAGEDPRISDDISVAPPAGLTVIIPARNEEASIGNLLSDLERLDDQSFVDRSSWRIIVVDDQSTDRTAEIVAGFTEVELVSTSSLPAGWSGKNWACHSGVQVALSTAEPDSLLLFLDSDVRLNPGAVDAAISRWMPTGGVSSVQPYHRVPTAVEQLSAVFNLVSMMAIGAGTDHPHGMFGPVVLCRVRDYLDVGGHESVRGAVIEDVALAHRFIDAGTPVSVAAGGDLIEFRMYPLGLRQLIEGWTKNMASGSTSVPWWRTLGVAWWVTGTGSVAWELRTLGGVAAGQVVASVSLYLLTALAIAVQLRRIGSFRWWASLGFPLPMFVFMAVFVRSWWHTRVRRSVVWRGRAIDLSKSTSTGGAASG